MKIKANPQIAAAYLISVCTSFLKEIICECDAFVLFGNSKMIILSFHYTVSTHYFLFSDLHEIFCLVTLATRKGIVQQVSK